MSSGPITPRFVPDEKLLSKTHLTCREVQYMLGISPATLIRWVNEGRIKCTYKDVKNKWGRLIELRSLLTYWYFEYVPQYTHTNTCHQRETDIEYDDDL